MVVVVITAWSGAPPDSQLPAANNSNRCPHLPAQEQSCRVCRSVETGTGGNTQQEKEKKREEHRERERGQREGEGEIE